jgi:hypothetical protein
LTSVSFCFRSTGRLTAFEDMVKRCLRVYGMGYQSSASKAVNRWGGYGMGGSVVVREWYEGLRTGWARRLYLGCAGRRCCGTRRSMQVWYHRHDRHDVINMKSTAENGRADGAGLFSTRSDAWPAAMRSASPRSRRLLATKRVVAVPFAQFPAGQVFSCSNLCTTRHQLSHRRLEMCTPWYP